MARWVPAGVDLDRLERWLDTGVEEMQPADNCKFIAAKCSRERECKRHGREFPDLVRAGTGDCPMRVPFYTPRELRDADGGAIRAIFVMRGTHNHVYPIWKPSHEVVRRVVSEIPSLPIRAPQVSWPFITF